MNSRYFTGIILILLGAGLLLDQLDIFSFGTYISNWWPVIIILFGVMQLSKSKGSIIFGSVITLIGLVILADNLDLVQVNFWQVFWPLLIILFGVSLLTGPLRKSLAGRKMRSDTIDILTIFSGRNETVISDNFKGGFITSVFGGSEVNLRGSMMAPEGASLDITAVFGGVTVIVEEECHVRTKGTPILGAMENKTRPNLNTGDIVPVLNINYFVMFGGIDIKNRPGK